MRRQGDHCHVLVRGGWHQCGLEDGMGRSGQIDERFRKQNYCGDAGMGVINGQLESLAWQQAQWGPLGWDECEGMSLSSGWSCLLHLRSLQFV